MLGDMQGLQPRWVVAYCLGVTSFPGFYAGRYVRFAAKVGCSLLPWSNLIPRLLSLAAVPPLFILQAMKAKPGNEATFVY